MDVIDLTQSDDEDNGDDTSSNPKRQKTDAADKKAKLAACRKKIEEELTCSIAYELPSDPVIAADGRAYERKMILQHFEHNGKKSLYTRKPMKNMKLIPAHQYKRIIDTLVALSDSNTREDGRVLEQILTENLVCPVTKELPFNPVIAENGRIYDRWAIDDDNAFPAIQHKNLIEASIEYGFITDKLLVEKWDEKCSEKKERDNLLANAKKGDVNAMISVAQNSESGSNGFEQDDKMVYKWYDRARQADSVPAMASVGELLCEGTGVPKNVNLGVRFISNAASRGSDFALYLLGVMNAEGKWGLRAADPISAIDLLEKCLSSDCDYHDMSDEYNEKAEEKLQELREANPLAVEKLRELQEEIEKRREIREANQEP